MKKPANKLDPNFCSLQKHEVAYIAKKFGIDPYEVRVIIKRIGKSRKVVYKFIREKTLK